MSTGNKKAYKKIKKTNEKDKRMTQLEKEIARLEHENGKLKRDSVEYKNRLAAFDGATRFDPNFTKLTPGGLQSVAENRVSRKSREKFETGLQPKSTPGSAVSKKKIRVKTMKITKKADASK